MQYVGIWLGFMGLLVLPASMVVLGAKALDHMRKVFGLSLLLIFVSISIIFLAPTS